MKIERKCEWDSTIFYVWPSVLKFRPRRFCSKKCELAYRSEAWKVNNPGTPRFGNENPMYGKHPVNFNPEGNRRRDGYIRVGLGKKRFLKHRLIMQGALGRELHRHEVVHHVDGDNTNNDITNLKVLTQSEHIALHRADLNAGKVKANRR